MKHKIAILTLGLFLTSGLFASAENSLVQMDIRKSGDNTVDMTFFTSGNYNDNISVLPKSDNKYVILLPKAASAGYSKPNLNGVKDLISGIDIKNVEDGGYTKITIITTKPLNITTSAKKSVPVTPEQREYETLIAQANAIKKDSLSKIPPAPVTQKTAITVNKAGPQKPAPKQTKPQPPKKESPKKSDIKLTEVTPKPKTTSVKPTEKIENIVPAALPDASTALPDVSQSPAAPVKEPSKLPKTLAFILIPILAFISAAKMIKNSVQNSNQLTNDFVRRTRPAKPEPAAVGKYSDIINNDDLNWQEKYKQHLEETVQPEKNYAFIKTSKKPAVQKPKPQQKRKKVLPAAEPVITEVPEIIEHKKVHSEEDSIKTSLKKATAKPKMKIKGFDNPLSDSDRDRVKHNSRFKKYDVPERETVDLSRSMLYTNPRTPEDANLKMGGYPMKKYIISSIEEFFATPDANKRRIKDSMASGLNRTQKAAPVPSFNKSSNPIKSSFNDNYLDNLVIKSGFHIDKNRGFFMVQHGETSAVIGKINDEIFMLKKFDKRVDTPIQVRKDKNNVYMVKADNFKSLVEVTDNKIGVLIEL
ncbi:MAG: hypothetical protein LBJ74_01880 [Heliobacteriaceae bacterium]|jgi:hypothetical protein|nr:hypothetical protein [Heliobacteriaceae bacterium]